MRLLYLLATIASAFLAMACGRKTAPAPLPPQNPPASEVPAVPYPSVVHSWAGKWNGVEGTYLRILAKPDSKYEVIIRNLDGERSFEGVGSTDHITFARDGALEKISATDGAATGMKWLAGKSNCLTVRVGEGYCRE